MPTTVQSPVVQDLLAKNHDFIQTFTPLPTIAEYANILANNPLTQRICIITCCDPRVVPEFIFGLGMGGAIVIRTPGGSVEPALAGMLAIDSLAPLTTVIVMRHTDCGTAAWTDEAVREALRERSGGGGGHGVVVGRRGESLDDMVFCESKGDSGDERLLREDVEWLKASPLIREQTKRNLVGMIYMTHTGEAKVVC